MGDIRDQLFSSLTGRQFCGVLIAEREGILSGEAAAQAKAEELGVELRLFRREGQRIGCGDRLGTLVAGAKAMAVAEETLIGLLAKASGIATAAHTAVLLAGGRIRIVSGAWKKVPFELRAMGRRAVVTGGAACRIIEGPMLYLDKNFLRMLGGISEALAAGAKFPDHTKVVQIRGENGGIAEQSLQAMAGGASVLMVDTGKREDLRQCLVAVKEAGVRGRTKIAFAGDVKLTDIPELAQSGADILCIGKEIIDARLLDIKLDVIGER